MAGRDEDPQRIAGADTAPDPVEEGSPGRAARPPQGLPRGTDLGRYIVLDRLGGGGMGEVYAAYDRELDRKLAIKLLLPGAPAVAEVRRSRLIREAQALARLQHPNVVSVYDIGAFGDQLFVAMEHVDGVTLSAWLRERRHAWREVLEVFLPAGRALGAAHRAGIVHRDFKPDNVMVGRDGRTRVLDFGLARSSPSEAPAEHESEPDPATPPSDSMLDTPLTRAGLFLGTPAYMSPEQWRHEPADPRADQFSFCSALWEGLYEARPFAGRSMAEIARGEAPGDPRPSEREVPAWLRAVVARGLSIDPAARHPSMEALVAALEADPEAARRKRLRTAALASAGVALAALAAFGLWRGAHVASPCDGMGARLAGVWDPPRKHSVRGAFAATGKGYAGDSEDRVERALDTYAAGWTAAREGACRATRVRGEQSERLLDLRMACLDRRLAELKAQVDVFAAGPDPEVLSRAGDAALALTPLDGCADPKALEAVVPPPEDPALRARVEGLRQGLAQARALEEAGKFGDALQRARPAAAEAESIGYAPALAEALLRRGSLEEDTGAWADAEKTIGRALLAAAEGRDDQVAARAWAEQLFLVGVDLERPRDALLERPAAEAAVLRAGSPPEIAAAFESHLGAVLGVDGKQDEAVRHTERALAITEGAFGGEDSRVAKVLRNLGATLAEQGRFEEARARDERALAIWEKALGPDHPYVANASKGLGIVFYDLGRYREAEAQEGRALSILERALGPDHPDVALCLVALGNVSHALGRHGEERDRCARAVRISEHALGPDHPRLAEALENLGLARAELGDPAGAERDLRRAVGIFERRLGAKHPSVASALTGLAQVEVEEHRPAQAEADASRALAILAAAQAPPAELADTRFTLAKALWARASERPRAITLARQAGEGYRAAGAGANKERAELEAWQRAHH